MPESRRSSAPSRFLDPQFLSRISRLEVEARRIVEGFISGMHRSPYHGFSVEFAEHREYVPGDDIRHIDWKVFGRSDRYYIKQYEEETNLRAYILLDVSQSMAYPDPPRTGLPPSKPASKFEYGAFLTAGLTHLLLRQQDAVGLALFDDRIRGFVQPSSSPTQLQILVGELGTAGLREKTDLGAIFHECADRIGKRSLVIILSDLFDDIDRLKRGLQHLRFKGHEVILFQILDQDELSFPFRRMTLFEGLEALPELLVNPEALREAYLQEMREHLTAVRKLCQDAHIDHVQLDTAAPLDVALSAYLAKRSGGARLG